MWKILIGHTSWAFHLLLGFVKLCEEWCDSSLCSIEVLTSFLPSVNIEILFDFYTLQLICVMEPYSYKIPEFMLIEGTKQLYFAHEKHSLFLPILF